MTETSAKAALTAGIGLFGLSLANLLTIVQIFAGFAAAVASCAAAYYYIRKAREK